ncbi:hypothetical protein Hanom_Chr02g00101191 [Helianthus anomalus]
MLKFIDLYLVLKLNIQTNVDEGVEEYSDVDMDDIRKYRSTYAVTSIFK